MKKGKTSRKHFFLSVSFAILSVCVWAGCGSSVFSGSDAGGRAAIQSQEEKITALLAYFEGLYHKHLSDSPARLALNNIASRHSWRAFKLLRGQWLATAEEKKKAVEHLTRLKGEIEKGLNWPHSQPPSYRIPFTGSKPVIDGIVKDAEWKDAFVLADEYAVCSTDQKKTGSVWKMMWGAEHLHVAAVFPDEKIYVRTEHIFQGDSLEIFLQPVRRMKLYWEIIVDSKANLLDGLQYNNKWGGFIGAPEDSVRDLKYAAHRTAEGFSVEVQIPFHQLPGYLNGNVPQAGQSIHFALVRTNRQTEDKPAVHSSPFPLLYGGHNIFGYAEGLLVD